MPGPAAMAIHDILSSFMPNKPLERSDLSAMDRFFLAYSELSMGLTQEQPSGGVSLNAPDPDGRHT